MSTWDDLCALLARYVDDRIPLASRQFQMEQRRIRANANSRGMLGGSGQRLEVEEAVLIILRQEADEFCSQVQVMLERSGKQFDPATVHTYAETQIQRFAAALWAGVDPFSEQNRATSDQIVRSAATRSQIIATGATLAVVHLPPEIASAFAALEGALSRLEPADHQRELAIETVESAKRDTAEGKIAKARARIRSLVDMVSEGEAAATAVQTISTRAGELMELLKPLLG